MDTWLGGKRTSTGTREGGCAFAAPFALLRPTLYSDSTLGAHHDAMRTTVTVDPNVMAMLQEEMAERRLSFKQVLNQAVRRGLGATSGVAVPAVRTRPHDFGFPPGIDRDRLNQLVDEPEIAEFVRRYRNEP